MITLFLFLNYIFSIIETYFTQHSYISILGYNLLKTNHPDGTTHGAVAIVIKKN